MTRNVLILGAAGRFGRATTRAFLDGGWTVTALVRDPARASLPAGVSPVTADVTDLPALARAAAGQDVIVHAINPPYPAWERQMPAITGAVIAAAQSSGAAVLIPGNVYNFGAGMPDRLGPDTPHAPTTRKGRLRVEMEERFRRAPGLRTLILRAGDFIEAETTGNWFDSILTKQIGAGRFTYPGPMGRAHAWAYLPDLARAAEALARDHADWAPFTDMPFAGFTLTGEELRAALEDAAGRLVRRRLFPWPALYAAAPFSRMMREVLEMRYLWRVPHRLSPDPLATALPGFRPTPLVTALADAIAPRLDSAPVTEAQDRATGARAA
ncbi:NAD(P)H-binding protein [Oceanomicrobium pacificus]|uniref:NAD(P)H-binding protein n=1 Tax=Oceanomicrobium pacificus TaxID=2692916 RepID=A0A6B0TS89_9RHOB|nr:NAD(P)H-binding protein [Oceanomicrobium pacificus]MXU64598.1 NAD(P)H-binding protein [Oceanomicrobium pacificus]